MQITLSSQPIQSRFMVIMSVGTVAAFLISSTIWILSDHRVWPWDQAWYGETTLDLWYAHNLGITPWIKAMVHAFGSKPPLFAWVGQFLVPLTKITGNVESAILLANVFATAGISVILYRLALSVGATDIECLAGVLVCIGAQLFVGLVNQYFVEVLQCLTVSAMMLVAWHARTIAPIRTTLLALIVATMSFLTKASSATYVLPLVVYIAVVNFSRKAPAQGSLGIADAVLAIVAVISLTAAVGWYAVNWKPMVQHIVDATSGDVALNYGSSVYLPTKLKYWLISLAIAISQFATITICVFGVITIALATALVQVLRQAPNRWIETAVDDGTLYALALAGTVVLTILTYSLQINEDTRFLMPLLPMIGILVSWSLSIVRNIYVSILFLIGLIANTAIDHAYAHGHLPLLGLRSPWLAPVDHNNSNAANLTEAVRATCAPEIANGYNIVGVEYAEFNANSAEFYSTKQRYLTGYRCYYISLGYAEADMQRALDRINAVGPKYILTIKPEKQVPPDFLNVVSLPMAKRLQMDSRFELVSNTEDYVLIFKKVR